MKPKVAILMSTYNGDKFLSQQIESIKNQTFENWHLYIRDDGSSDQTLEILNRYQHIDPKITLINEDLEKFNLGPKDSFLKLLKIIKADYYFFCDQDDYWEENKIQKMVNKIKDYDEPCLVYCGLECVDADLLPVNDPFEMSIGSMNGKNFCDRCICNDMPGCTMAFNKRLNNIFLKTKETQSIHMHDWWIALIAAAFGRIIFIPEKLVKYRLHANNTIGADKKMSMIEKLTNLKRLQERIEFVNMTVNQGRAFYYQYQDLLNSRINNFLKDISNQRNCQHLFFRAKVIIKYHPKSCNLFRTLVYYCIFIIFNRKYTKI